MKVITPQDAKEFNALLTILDDMRADKRCKAHTESGAFDKINSVDENVQSAIAVAREIIELRVAAQEFSRDDLKSLKEDCVQALKNARSVAQKISKEKFPTANALATALVSIGEAAFEVVKSANPNTRDYVISLAEGRKTGKS